MPKEVDHDQRREELLEAVWRVIARALYLAEPSRDLMEYLCLVYLDQKQMDALSPVHRVSSGAGDGG